MVSKFIQLRNRYRYWVEENGLESMVSVIYLMMFPIAMIIYTWVLHLILMVIFTGLEKDVSLPIAFLITLVVSLIWTIRSVFENI